MCFGTYVAFRLIMDFGCTSRLISEPRLICGFKEKLGTCRSVSPDPFPRLRLFFVYSYHRDISADGALKADGAAPPLNDSSRRRGGESEYAPPANSVDDLIIERPVIERPRLWRRLLRSAIKRARGRETRAN